jgi:sugar phosphate permease
MATVKRSALDQAKAQPASATAGPTWAVGGRATALRWRHITPVLLIIWIVGQIDKSNISIVIANPGFLADLHLQHAQALLGWLTTGLIIAYGAAAPAWGWLVARAGARRAAMLSLLLWGLVCFVSGLATSYGLLLTARIVLGVAEAALYPVTLSLVARWFPLRERGRATALWWIGTMIGPMITGLLVTWLTVSFGWRAQFFALGVLAVVLPLPLAALLLRDTPAQEPRVNAAELALINAGGLETEPAAAGALYRQSRGWLRNYRYWLIVLSIIFNSIFFWGWAVWLPTYLKVTRHFAFSKAGYLTFAIYGGATLTILLVGTLSDRWFRRAPLAATGWVLAGLFLIAATLVPDRTLCVVLMTLSLCAQQTGVSSAQMLYHSVVGRDEMATSQGYATGAIQILGSFSPVMIGYFLQAKPGDFTMGFGILAAAVFVAAGCMAALAREGL